MRVCGTIVHALVHALVGAIPLGLSFFFFFFFSSKRQPLRISDPAAQTVYSDNAKSTRCYITWQIPYRIATMCSQKTTIVGGSGYSMYFEKITMNVLPLDFVVQSHKSQYVGMRSGDDERRTLL
jgi:hypothetical protein